MATDAILSDVGTIYKRLFNHRPVIQNEVHLFVREFETKRGNSDLQCLQSCVSMASEMEAVYLQDISATRPHFKAIRHLSEEVSELCNDILSRERESLTISSSEQDKLDEQVEEYRLQLVQEHAALEAHYKEESEKLEEEIRLEHELRVKLRTVSVGSSAGLSLSNNGSTVDSLELSREEGEQEEERGEGEGEGEGAEERGEGEEERGEGEGEGEEEGERGRDNEGGVPEASATDGGTEDDGEREPE